MIQELDDIKYLHISKGDLILSLDRLTRFKFPAFKYYRVFNDILSKYLLFPKLNKHKLEKLDLKTYKYYVEKIWNESVDFHLENVSNTHIINRIIKEEEFSAYNLNEDLKELIDNNLNYDGVLSLIKKDTQVPLNLKRLIICKEHPKDKKDLREKYFLKFPVEKVILTEGITEEILLPRFAAAAGFNFDKNGVHLISAGGKNQVAKLYCELREELKLPIFILLDADADKTSESIHSIIRNCDKIHLIKKGEFEDLFSRFLIKRTINNRYKNILQCCVEDFKSDLPMTKILCEYYRLNNLGDFQKSDFAKEISLNIKNANDLTDEIIDIIDEIKNL